MRPALLALPLVALMAMKCHHEGDPAMPQATPYVWTAPSYYGTRADSLEAPLTVEGVALGKQLFADSGLSADGKVSCRSCHRPENAFGDPRVVSTGIYGRQGTRNASTLVNLAYQTHFFWDGRATNIEELLIQPMTRADEMGLTETQITEKLQKEPYTTLFAKAFEGAKPSSQLARRAISMYVRTLVSAGSKYDRWKQGTYTMTDQEQRGMTLFFTHPVAENRTRGANCGDCHGTISTAGNPYQFLGFKNNGLDINTANDVGLQNVTGNADDRGKFKVPSLRNIALTAPYMHDGRFKTLEEVLDHYNDPTLFSKPNVDILIQLGSNSRFGGSLGLTDQEKADVIAFLHTLTDTTYLQP